jgi:hypothetical protein
VTNGLSQDEIDQIDVVGAFLDSPIEEKIYIELPKGFSTNKNGKVVLVKMIIALEL